MNWRFLLPYPWNPQATALSNAFFVITVGYTVFWIFRAIYALSKSKKLVRKYLAALPSSSDPDSIAQAVESWGPSSGLPLFEHFRSHLVLIRTRSSRPSSAFYRIGSAAEILDEHTLAPSLINNRFIATVPAIATGLGVLGTFVGLQLGIGGLNLDGKALQNLDESIKPLIVGSAVAFSTSVWGVTCSLVFTVVEKFIEMLARVEMRKLHEKLDILFPRFNAETSLHGVMEATLSSDETLKGLATAIGEKMQEAIGQIGERIAQEVRKATAAGSEDLGKISADLMATALTDQLGKLGNTVDGMATRFEKQFGDANQDMVRTLQTFQPTVESLNTVVGASTQAVEQAVQKLNAHEAVMQVMGESAKELNAAAQSLSSWKESLEVSAGRNQEAARAQEKAASSNVRAADELGKIAEKLPEVLEAIQQAGSVIGSLGAPLVELRQLLEMQPEREKEFTNQRSLSEDERSRKLMMLSNDLAEKVGKAAQEFGRVSGLAEKLGLAADSLHEASSQLEKFGSSVDDASERQRQSAAASERAAVASENASKLLLPLPAQFSQLQGGLEQAGNAVHQGATQAYQMLREAKDLQASIFSGIQVGLEGTKARLQELIRGYGDEVEGQTKMHMENWTKTVTDCLKTYENQVVEIQGGIEELQKAIQQMRTGRQ